MPCPLDNLPLLATGRLSGFAKWRTARHVKSCPDCAAELAQLSSLSSQLRALTLSEPSADLDERVLAIGYGKSKYRPSLPRPTLRGFLLAFPLLMMLLTGGIGLPFVRGFGASTPQLVARLDIVWNPALNSEASVRQELPTIVDSLAIDGNLQNVEHWGDLGDRKTPLNLKQRIVRGKPTNPALFDRWIDNISRYGKAHNNLWTVNITSAPQSAEELLLRQRAGFLLAFCATGLLLGGIVSLTIWLLRMGGLPSVIPFVVLGFLGSWIFDTYQSASGRNYEFHAEGTLIVHSEKTSLWSEEDIFNLSHSEEMRKGLQDKRMQKIRVLKMERRIRPFSFRYSANGRYSNYSAGTVNLWMHRVQERLLKEWKEKERPSRVDEMNPPVRVIEAADPTSVSLDAKKSSLALGIFLGLFLGGIYGYFYRPTRDRGRGASFPEA